MKLRNRLTRSKAAEIWASVRHWPRPVLVAFLALGCLIVYEVIILVYVFVFSPSHSLTVHNAVSKQGSHKTDSNGKGAKTNNPADTTTQPPTKSSGSLAPSSRAATTPTAGTAYPASVLDLADWKLTLPTGRQNDPDEITQPQLTDYVLPPYFQVNAARDGVLFEAPVDGVTTSGSNFPRSELREMTNNGQQEASWSTTQGTSTMTVREAVNHLPAARPELVAAQVHGPSAYVILVRLDGSDLFVEGSNGKNLGDLNSNYTLGTVFDLQIVVQNGHILVSYNGIEKVDYANSSSGNYFKAGCYTQANTSDGGNPSDYGQTTIYSLNVSHT